MVDPETEMNNFVWPGIDDDLFEGATPTGAAIAEVVQKIGAGPHGEPVDPDMLAPSILLISDGEPNGKNPTYEEALDAALQDKAFKRANRIALAVDVDNDGKESLQKFGRLSSSLKAQGLEPYMEATDDKGILIEIIKRVTAGMSQGT